MGVVGELISRELLQQEAIEGLVGVVGANDVVAVAIEVSIDWVRAECTFRIGVTGGIEPVLAPALAVMGGGEQVIDQTSISIWACVPLESNDLLRGGRESDEVEVCP